MISRGFLRLDTLSQLRAAPVAEGTLVLLVGKDVPYDGKGGLYRWSAASVAADESGSMSFSVIASTRPGQVTGRWIRVFHKVRVLPQGFLIYTGGVMEFFSNDLLSDANGRVQTYLTYDGTVSGAPIFTDVWQPSFSVLFKPTNVNSAIIGNIEPLPIDLKSAAVNLSQLKPTSLPGVLTSLLGLIINPAQVPASGTKVRIFVKGV